MNRAIIPSHSRHDVKGSFIENLEAWKNFTQRISKNPFVKQFLVLRDGNKCDWCKRSLTESCNVHHKTYNHSCSFHATKEITTSKRIRIVPDCEACKQGNETRFLACMDKLSLVHGLCNKKIDEHRNPIAHN